MSQITWERRHEAFKAIWEALTTLKGIASLPEGKSVDNITFTYDADGNIASLVFKQDAETLFTLTFSYDALGNLIGITRT